MADRAMSLVELEALLDSHRAEGKKIVFTNGCFDLLHVGHVRYLTEAKRLGDILVVAINSDASVAALKPGRPIVAQAERAEMLAALKMVDYVTVFDEETPYETIKALRPHVLVKGGDWKVEDIVGSDIVGETWSLPYEQNFSTSNIIRKVMENCPR